MEFIYSLPFKFLLPVILLALQVALKFFIDRRATAFNFVTALLEVPISILFLSLSLLAGYIINGKGDVHFAFCSFITLIILLVFCIFFWRRSVDNFERKNFWSAISLGGLNYVISLPTLFLAIYFIIQNTL